MKFVKITDPNSEDFKVAWEIYEYSFPSDERRTLETQKELMKNPGYNFFIVKKNDNIVALITDWDFGDFLFVEHLAVRKDLRGQGIGTELLTEHLKSRKVILEVERPSDDTTIKRIRFYEKLGFKLNNHNYIQPPYGEGKSPVPMFLMTYPDFIDEPTFIEARRKVHTIVYGLKVPLESI